MKKIPLYFRKTIFEKLFNIAEYSNLSKEEKIMYDSSLKRKWDNENVLDYAVREAEKKGLKKGKREEALTIAREMKKEGMPISQIAKLTKLSVEEIENI